MVKLVKAGMRDDHYAALSQERFVPVHVEVIAKRHHLYKQRIKCGIYVIGRNIRNSRDQDVTLSLHRYFVLAIIELKDLVVNRLCISRVTTYQLILSRDCMKHFPTGRTRHLRESPRHGLPLHPVEKREFVLI